MDIFSAVTGPGAGTVVSVGVDAGGGVSEAGSEPLSAADGGSPPGDGAPSGRGIALVSVGLLKAALAIASSPGSATGFGKTTGPADPSVSLIYLTMVVDYIDDCKYHGAMLEEGTALPPPKIKVEAPGIPKGGVKERVLRSRSRGKEVTKTAEKAETVTQRQKREIETVATAPYRREMIAIEKRIAEISATPGTQEEHSALLIEEAKDDPLMKAFLAQHTIEKRELTEAIPITKDIAVTALDGTVVKIDSITGTSPDSLTCTYTNPDGTKGSMTVDRRIIADQHRAHVMAEVRKTLPAESIRLLELHEKVAAAKTPEEVEAILAAENKAIHDDENNVYDSLDGVIEGAATAAGIPVKEDLRKFIIRNAADEKTNFESEEDSTEKAKAVAEIDKKLAKDLAELDAEKGVLATPEMVVKTLSDGTKKSRSNQVDLFKKEIKREQLRLKGVKGEDPSSIELRIVLEEKIKQLIGEKGVFEEETKMLNDSQSQKDFIDKLKSLAAGELPILQSQAATSAIRTGEINTLVLATEAIKKDKVAEDAVNAAKSKEKKLKAMKIAGIGGIAGIAAMLIILFQSEKRQPH